MANGTVLVVDDERNIVQLARLYLSSEGYAVEAAYNGVEALEKVKSRHPDLVVLDLMMPEMDGWEVCRRLRKESDIPIIILTARSDDVDKIIGLELGADDYVTKPYSSRELIARIHAVLRRRGQRPVLEDTEALQVGAIRLDAERHTVEVDGRPAAFPLKEFDLLELLMRNAGRVLTRGQIIDRVWGSDYVGDTKTLDVHVKRVRAKIERDPSNPTLLLTVRGLGYKIADDAR